MRSLQRARSPDGTALESSGSMRKNSKIAIAIATVIAVAGVTSILMRHGGSASTPRTNRAQGMTPQGPDAQIVKAIQNANVRVDRLSATNVGGVVVLKGYADPAAAPQATTVGRQLGFAHVGRT